MHDSCKRGDGAIACASGYSSWRRFAETQGDVYGTSSGVVFPSPWSSSPCSTISIRACLGAGLQNAGPSLRAAVIGQTTPEKNGAFLFSFFPVLTLSCKHCRAQHGHLPILEEWRVARVRSFFSCCHPIWRRHRVITHLCSSAQRHIKADQSIFPVFSLASISLPCVRPTAGSSAKLTDAAHQETKAARAPCTFFPSYTVSANRSGAWEIVGTF